MEHIEADVGFQFHPAVKGTSENGMSKDPNLHARTLRAQLVASLAETWHVQA